MDDETDATEEMHLDGERRTMFFLISFSRAFVAARPSLHAHAVPCAFARNESTTWA